MSVVGARPNFMKVAPLIRAMEPYGNEIEHQLIHTGQHYDRPMSDAILSDLEMPLPDINLSVGSGTHAHQTARMMTEIEPVLAGFDPDIVIVPGDVNSTMATAVTACKLGFKVAHVEAGLRSFDMSMPEEVNRRITDSISEFLFTPDEIASLNLEMEGVDPARIHFVGNVMIDSLEWCLERARASRFAKSLGLRPGNYAVLTLHRPTNTDFKEKLEEILDAVVSSIGEFPVIFPAHPRTQNNIEQFGMLDWFAKRSGRSGIRLFEPFGYFDFLGLISDSRMVLTDSGGLQEETTALGIPCVTIRENTERPITIRKGTNLLAGTQRAGIVEAIVHAMDMEDRQSCRPEKWDGKAAQRIISALTAVCRK